jgi:hypothetical protein
MYPCRPILLVDFRHTSDGDPRRGEHERGTSDGERQRPRARNERRGAPATTSEERATGSASDHERGTSDGDPGGGSTSSRATGSASDHERGTSDGERQRPRARNERRGEPKATGSASDHERGTSDGERQRRGGGAVPEPEANGEGGAVPEPEANGTSGRTLDGIRLI